jgi:hypothetical protein
MSRATPSFRQGKQGNASSWLHDALQAKTLCLSRPDLDLFQQHGRHLRHLLLLYMRAPQLHLLLPPSLFHLLMLRIVLRLVQLLVELSLELVLLLLLVLLPKLLLLLLLVHLNLHLQMLTFALEDPP